MSFGTILTIASIGIGIAGAAASTSATINANNYQAQVAERNRQLNELNATRAEQAGQQAQIQQDDQTRALLGEQLAEQGASGLSLNSKSSMLTRKTARMLGRLDSINVRQAADVEAFNFRMAAEDNYNQIQYLNSANNSALLTGFLDAASVGLTGLSSDKQLTNSLIGARKSNVIQSGVNYTGSALRFAR